MTSQEIPSGHAPWVSGSVHSPAPAAVSVGIAADYLTLRGGAERVEVAMLSAFPDAQLLAAMYDPDATFPEFRTHQVRTLWPDRIKALRHDVRRAFPVLAATWSRAHMDADVTFASSAGWAHAVNTTGRKIVYCHNPARWLYQPDDYFQGFPPAVRPLVRLWDGPLRKWDYRAARSADHYLVNSTSVHRRVLNAYGIDAEILHPPVTIDATGEQEPPAALEPGYLLTVSRPRGYKNTELLVEAISRVPDARLVVVGGPTSETTGESSRIIRLRGLSDSQLRWLYAHARALLAASFEDFGLTPIEANAFGTPAIALRAGGYLDSVVEGVNGLFFDENTPSAIAQAVDQLDTAGLEPDRIRAHADRFSLARFVARLRALAASPGA